MEAPKEMKEKVEAPKGMENGEVISLKVFIDNERKKVVFAESDKDFVDILVSFLTLPIRTFIKHLEKQDEIIGSMNSLCEATERLDVSHFKTNSHKTMLLHLRNPSQAQCRKLKLNVDDTKAIKYYLCEYCYHHPDTSVSYRRNTKCKCGKLMNKEMYNVDDYDGYRSDVDSREGVFVKATANYIVTDDLQIMPSSLVTALEMLTKFGVKDANTLQEKTLILGKTEVLSLLRHSLLSKTALTNIVFPRKTCTGILMYDSRFQVPMAPDTRKKITLKLMCRKSNKMVLYAEAQEDFINYLLAVPAITLGSMVKFLGKTPTLGSLWNLYKSVEDLTVYGYVKSEDMKAKLLSPKLAIQSAFLNSNRRKYRMTNMVNDDHRTVQPDPTSSISMNLKSPTLETIGNFEIVKGPATYLVTDNLAVIPLSQDSSISVLKYINVPISDLESQEVTFGKEEARRLLEASLISDTVLTYSFDLDTRRKCGMVRICGLNY